MNPNSLKHSQKIASLYQQHNSWLHRWLKQKLNCEYQAMDIVQSTFLRLLLKPEKVKDLREPRAYITTIAHGLVNDYWRHQSLKHAYLEYLDSQEETVTPSEEHKLAVIESLIELNTMLTNLSPQVREAFLLSQLEGFTYRQIATKLGVCERTVKNYMSQAMLQCLKIKNRTVD